MTDAIYTGGWPFAHHTSMTLAAFKFDDWYNRWEGNLHFPDGTCRVYLEVNPVAGLKKNAPVLFIKAVQGDITIGVLMRVVESGRALHYGRINTGQALAVEGYVIPSGGRFILYAVKRDLPPTGTKSRVNLYLTPYKEGERWLANYRTSEYRKRKLKACEHA